MPLNETAKKNKNNNYQKAMPLTKYLKKQNNNQGRHLAKCWAITINETFFVTVLVADQDKTKIMLKLLKTKKHETNYKMNSHHRNWTGWWPCSYIITMDFHVRKLPSKNNKFMITEIQIINSWRVKFKHCDGSMMD